MVLVLLRNGYNFIQNDMEHFGVIASLQLEL